MASRSLGLLPLLLLAAAVGVQSCASPAPRHEPEPPPPTVNHALHAEHDLMCIDCHDVEETGTPSLPRAETCFECHEDLAEENERVNAYFAATRSKDGSYRWPRLAYTDDLVVNHEHHAEYEVGCADCHGAAAERGFRRPAALDLKATCLDCHTERKASVECATCHEVLRKDEKPPGHDAAFLRAHGGRAPREWQTGARSTCAQCHEVPQSCNACHKETKPAGHAAAGFSFDHGRDEVESCALCHQEQSCVRCHQTTKPANHTASFERRLHGIVAAVERQSCATCHKQDSCNRCHETTRPLTHRGSWGAGQQTHCVSCHEPLPASGCYVCHKSALGHLAAPSSPLDTAHTTSTDPAGCQACHIVLPHLDGGGRCRRCHRGGGWRSCSSRRSRAARGTTAWASPC